MMSHCLKNTPMKNFLAFLLLLLWLSLGAWFYICKVKNLCNDGPFLSSLKSNSKVDQEYPDTLYSGIATTETSNISDTKNQGNKSDISQNGNVASPSESDASTLITAAPSIKQLRQPEIEFEYGQYSLYGSGPLTRYAANLKIYLDENSDQIARIKGHTDSFEEGDFRGDLGLKRAEYIKKYLVSEDIGEDQIEAISMGSKEPIISNALIIGRIKNRRVEIDIINKQ